MATSGAGTMDVETNAGTPDTFHGRFADDGDIRIESSSMIDTGETPQETLQRVKAEHAAPAKASEPTAFDTGADPGDEQPPADPKAPPAPAEKDGDPPKKGSARWRHDELQARIHASTRELHEVRGQLQAEERRLAELRAQAESLAKGQPAKPSDGAAPPQTAAPDDDQPPQWDGPGGYEDQGKSFSQFMADHAAWTKRQAVRDIKAEQERIAQEQREREAQMQDRQAEDAARARVRDIIQTLNQDQEVAAALQDPEFLDMPQTPFMGALVKLHAKGADVLRHLALNPADGYAFASLELTPPIMEAFRGTDDPVRLLSALANDVPEAQRIARLSPYQAMKVLAALEGSTSPGAKSGTPAATTRQPLPSPLPAKVGARSAATVSSLAELATNTDHADDYFRRRMAGEDVTA